MRTLVRSLICVVALGLLAGACSKCDPLWWDAGKPGACHSGAPK